MILLKQATMPTSIKKYLDYNYNKTDINYS